MDDKKRGTAFAYPMIGEVVPDDYVKIENGDGTISYVPPEEAGKGESDTDKKSD